MENFNKIKTYLKTVLDKPTYDKWVKPLTFIKTMNKIILVGSPDEKKTSWIKKNLSKKINTFTKKELNLTFKLIPFYEEDDDEIIASSLNKNKLKYNNIYSSNLQKKYTFDSFAQLDANRIAYSFAYSVSEFPAKSYNPLYIYSDVGLGKTHLLYAIGNKIVETKKNMSVIYLTSSDLMNEYVEYSRFNKRSEFLKKYTSVDVLLIDDIQYITKWGGTSEQFYYIFNKLIQNEKQIVICSDKHPDNIPDLQDRIKSRFEWGGVVDILPYDLEGRIIILKKKIDERRNLFKNDFEITEEVLYFIASSIKDNIRKLEGALNRLIGYANLKYSDKKGNKITLDFAKEALKPYISIKKKIITIERIQEYVAKKFDLKPKELRSKSNLKKIAYPRQIAIYICKKLTKNSLTEIGEKFGGKHHTTILYSINKIEEKTKNDQEFADKIDYLIKFFKE